MAKYPRKLKALSKQVNTNLFKKDIGDLQGIDWKLGKAFFGTIRMAIVLDTNIH
jgi:hypothetical protein